MTNQTRLLEKIVDFRMGHWASSQSKADIEEVLDYIKADNTTSMVAVYNASKRSIYPINGYHERLVREEDYWALSHRLWGSDMRVANFCSYLDCENASGDFVMSWTDAAYWNFNERTSDDGFPIIQFVRHKNDSKAVLFPLDYKYMGVGSGNLPLSVDKHDIPFERKRDEAIWRGRLSGTIRRFGRTKHAEHLKNEIQSAKSEEEINRVITDNLHYPRLLLCRLYNNHPEIDVGITGPGDLHLGNSSLGRGDSPLRLLLGHKRTLGEQLQYKYIICMPGNDFPSGLYWALTSNSVVLMPDPSWRTPLDFGLVAWEHFVPISDDLSNIPQMMSWCRSNEKEAIEITKRAKDYCRSLCDINLRTEADRLVVKKYEDLVRKKPKPRSIAFATDKFLSTTRMAASSSS